MKTKPTLYVNLHAGEVGRGSIELGLDSFKPAELEFLVSLFGRAEKGSAVEFGVSKTEDGRHVMGFFIGIKDATVQAIPAR